MSAESYSVISVLYVIQTEGNVFLIFVSIFTSLSLVSFIFPIMTHSTHIFTNYGTQNGTHSSTMDPYNIIHGRCQFKHTLSIGYGHQFTAHGHPILNQQHGIQRKQWINFTKREKRKRNRKRGKNKLPTRFFFFFTAVRLAENGYC